MMIEQPLAHDDIIDHAELQVSTRNADLPRRVYPVRTPCGASHPAKCLPHNQHKLGRVGGFAEAKRVHDVCMANGIPVWCGGMLESGIGRAHNIAFSTLPNFVLPGDVSASKRYWQQDIIVPPVEIDEGWHNSRF